MFATNQWLSVAFVGVSCWVVYQISGIASQLIRDVLADSMIKGAFVMGILYTLKDHALVLGSFLWSVTVARGLLSLKVSSDGDNKTLYAQISFWLAKKFADRIPNKKASSEYASNEWFSSTEAFSVQFNPDDGVYLLTYEEAMISLHISSRQLENASDSKPTSVCTLLFSTFRWNAKILNSIVSDAREFWENNQSHENTTVKQAHSWWPQGKFLVSNPKITTLDHLCLDPPVRDRIFAILDNFKTNANSWKEHHQVHRESILLVGPPGNGKTKLLSFIAGYLNYDIMLINLSSGPISDDALLETFARVPKRTLIALEEIDSAVPSRDVIHATGGKNKSITMSGLLQALDGPVNKEGPIVVATTNRYESLDPALIRPGRFNHHIKLDWSTPYQQENLFKCYYPEATSEETAIFSRNLSGKQISCVTIVSYLRLSKASEEKTVEDVIDGAKLIKPSHDVSGEKVHLDSPCDGLLSTLHVSPQTIHLLRSYGVQTLRHLKFASLHEIYQAIEEVPKYKLRLEEEAQLHILHEQVKVLVGNITYIDFDQPISEFFKKYPEVPSCLIELLDKNLKTVEKLRHIGISDLDPILTELNFRKLTSIEQLSLKIVFQEISKAKPLKEKKFDICDKLSPVLDGLGVSKETQRRIEKLGILTLKQFNICGVARIIQKFSKPKYKVSIEEKIFLAQAVEAVSARIEEREIFV